jgi:hypothetical protein
MPEFSGTVKSLGKEFGFVECAELKEQYGKDTFINRALTGWDAYAALNVGELITFDCSINPKGDPVAVNINGIPPAKGPLSAHGGKGGKGFKGDTKDKGKGPMSDPSFGYSKGYGDEYYVEVQQEMFMPPPQSKGPPPSTQTQLPRPSFLPKDAQQVNLFDEAGWFVSQASCERFLEGMRAAQLLSGGAETSSYDAGPQQMKRAYDYESYGKDKGGKGKYGKDAW